VRSSSDFAPYETATIARRGDDATTAAPMELKSINAPGFVPPKGYQDAVLATDVRTLLALGGHVAFDAARRIVSPGELVPQFRAALVNLKATLEAAGFAFEAVVKLTIYVVDVVEYRAKTKELGAAWRDVFGRAFPAMTLIGVTALMEPGAVVEIDGFAVR
jgi:enamine deaminase RidA (YjgF/YER057c/UK114 family)